MKISFITMTIEETFPELSKYIEEIPVKVSGHKNLQDYYDSLAALLENYAPDHRAT
jgi:hypothetical protein